MDQQVIRDYETVKDEVARLSEGPSRVEFERTKEILQRYLPNPPGEILDVGGGPVAYAFWLAEKGYTVHLIDIVPLHVEQAKANESSQHLATIRQGDAREIDLESGSIDVVLLLGPLYHLPERSDRIKALSEAYRVLKPGGIVFCAGISRFASLLDGLKRGFLSDPKFREIVDRDLKDGKHVNPEENPHYFTTAYFHRSRELQEEVSEAGFAHIGTLGLEGPAWLLGDLDERWSRSEERETVLEVLRLVEEEPALQGVSLHLLTVGKKN